MNSHSSVSQPCDPHYGMEGSGTTFRHDFTLSPRALCLKYCGKLPIVSGRVNVQAHYLCMRISGESHNMAELLALRKFPGVKGTDSDFMKGAFSGDDHSKTDALNAHYASLAKQNGTDINGKKYLPSLAAFPGDPEAWVSGLSDVRRVCADRGWNCTGAVEHVGFMPGQHAPVEDTPIGEDIVDEHVSACLRAFPEGEHTPRLVDDIRESVTAELSGAVDLSPELLVGDHNFEMPED